jgi:hypothetical protein
MALSTGLWSFKTLASALDLKIFTRLSGGRVATVPEMADELGFAHRPADLLMTACASLGLLERSGEGLPQHRTRRALPCPRWTVLLRRLRQVHRPA